MKQVNVCWNALLAVLALATMLGCQGLSSSKSSSQQRPTNGSGELAATPTSISLGSVQVGTNQTQPVTVTASGKSSVTITKASTTGSGFSVSGPSLPVTLTSGQSKSFNVTYTPKAPGFNSGNLAIVSNASNSTLNVALTGTGVAPGAITAKPSSLNFGSVLVGNKQTVSESLTNSGGSSLTITAASATGSGFSLSGLNLPLTLNAGQSKSFSVTYAPKSAGNSNGNLSITSSDSDNPLSIPLVGNGVTAGALTANPTSLGFGSIQAGDNKTLQDTLTNTGGSNVTISQASASGTGFSISGLNPPLTLAPGQQFTFSVIFTPPSAGGFSGNVAVSSDASNPNLSIPLTGTGTATGQLAVSPTSQNFGTVTVGSNGQLGGRLTASGATVIVTTVNVSNPDFVVSGLNFPVTIPAGQYVPFTVTFTPQSAGAESGTASFVSNASNSPGVESLSGTGANPQQHSVGLSWTASDSSNISSYNVYRGTKSGGPYSKIGSVEAPTTAYTDSNVTDGVTYYYVTTAVNSTNQESGYSNQAQATP